MEPAPAPPVFTIRHGRPDDHEAVVRIFSGPRVIRGTLQLPYPSPEVWRQRFAELERGLVMLMACHEEEPIGMLGIHTRPDQPRQRHAAMIGMAVRDDWQGRGAGHALMVAALDLADGWLNLVRLELQVFTDNEPALRLYRRHGFEIEGTLRAAAFGDGAYHDVFQMARVRL